jgi:hypothetical protein
MEPTDYILDALLVLAIFRQARERRADLRSLLLPVGLVAFAVTHYVTAVPTGGNDVLLDVAMVAVGMAIGALCGVAMRLRTDDRGAVLARAGGVALVAWCVGMGSRFAFSVWADHGGADDVARFSAAHAITGADAWTTALVLMAVAQVTTKIVVQLARTRRLRPASPGAVVVAN